MIQPATSYTTEMPLVVVLTERDSYPIRQSPSGERHKNYECGVKTTIIDSRGLISETENIKVHR